MTIQGEMIAKIGILESQVRRLQEQLKAPTYKGELAIDFTTTELPYPGDYGTQTTDNEVQVNINGTVRAISTAAL